jgi:hypothetical protein
MNSFDEFMKISLRNDHDFHHNHMGKVARKSYLAGLRRAAEIAADAEHNKHTIIEFIESEASLIEGSTGEKT